MIHDTGVRINAPSAGTVVFFHPWEKKRKDGKPFKSYPVLIKSGDYLVNGRLSNFWYWQRVYSTGQVKKTVEHGYGNFTKAEGVETKTVVKITV
jgi:hypothetical protein